MSSYRSKKLVAALEDIEAGGGGEIETVPASAVEVEAAASDVASDTADLDQMDVAVEEAEADIDALSDVQDVMQESVDSGEGMSEQTAEMAEVAVESIRARLGFSGKRVLPAMESFGQKGSRLAATQCALESVVDTIKTAVNSVIQWLKDMFVKFKGFLAGLFKSREAMEKHLKALLEKANALDASAKAKEQTVKFGSMKTIAIGKEVSLQTAEKVADNIKAVGGKTSAFINKAAEGLRTNSADDAKASLSKEAISELLKSLPEVKVEKGNKDVTYYGPLAGGAAYGVEEHGEADDKTVRLVMATAETNPESAKALAKDEIIKLLNSAMVDIKGLKALEKVEKESEALVKASIAAMEAAVNLATKSESHKDAEAEKEAQKKAKAIVRQVRTNMTNVTGFIRGAVGMLFNTVKASADYASASISNIKGEDKKKEEDKK